MTVHTWLDKVATIFALDDGKGSLVRSVHMFDAAKMPEAVGEDDVPIAISFVDGFRPQFSCGGPQRNHWSGWTEFYLTRNLDKASLQYVAGFASKILVAMAANMKLSSTVDLFAPADMDKAIEIPVVLAYGSQMMHYGVIVHWIAIENTASLTVA